MEENLIEQFIDRQSLDAMTALLEAQDDALVVQKAEQVSLVFDSSLAFKTIADSSTKDEEKLTQSFHRNLQLLIQKTWVEKSDEDLKAQVLYQLDEFCKHLQSHDYQKAYTLFFTIVDNVVYLMFGPQTKAKEFSEYALRIDPEFGIFWWYMQSLPREAEWSQNKSRIAVLLGMYFLANY